MLCPPLLLKTKVPSLRPFILGLFRKLVCHLFWARCSGAFSSRSGKEVLGSTTWSPSELQLERALAEHFEEIFVHRFLWGLAGLAAILGLLVVLFLGTTLVKRLSVEVCPFTSLRGWSPPARVLISGPPSIAS